MIPYPDPDELREIAQVDRTHSRRTVGGDVKIGMNGRSEGKQQLLGPGSNAGLGSHTAFICFLPHT